MKIQKHEEMKVTGYTLELKPEEAAIIAKALGAFSEPADESGTTPIFFDLVGLVDDDLYDQLEVRWGPDEAASPSASDNRNPVPRVVRVDD